MDAEIYLINCCASDTHILKRIERRTGLRAFRTMRPERIALLPIPRQKRLRPPKITPQLDLPLARDARGAR